MSRHEIYNDDGTTDHEMCPDCGDAFLAAHSDRTHCGRCGFTEWK